MKFKGTSSQPFSKQCKADNVDNWEISFDRRLFRDIRSISGGVMVVTASSVGGEILFDAEGMWYVCKIKITVIKDLLILIFRSSVVSL